MKVAIYGKQYDRGFNKYIKQFFKTLKKLNYKFIIYSDFYEFIKEASKFDPEPENTFSKPLCENINVDLVFSIGGDGTFLECVRFVRDCETPIAGINSGRLGFLANISKEEIKSALIAIYNNDFTIEDRTLLNIKSKNKIFKDFNYALNELAIQKRDTGSMITVKVSLNGNFLNTYWADGLIISTPTGSTAYSLSAGGPIVVPGSQNFIITPIAPHNLTVRPIVVPNNQELLLEIKSRTENYLLSADYRTKILKTSVKIRIIASDFKIKTVRIKENTFFDTLRNKLLWGLDKRN